MPSCLRAWTRRTLVGLAALIAATAPARGGEESGAGSEDPSALFLRAVRPVLKAKCLGCHGEGDELEAGLDLRSREAMLRGGEGGPALVPGRAEESPLYEVVLRTGFPVMPPKEANRLTPEEVAALRAWIDAGAPWAEPAPVADGTPAWTSDAAEAWAFRPVRKPAVPAEGIDPAQVLTPIDAFLMERLNAAGLAPAPPADRRSLLRRATFDLTGLPPTPEEVAAFEADPAPDAFDRVIERLLASPRYGEKWGRHWLDVVRYADTDGYSNDYERPNAWRYRDYVIRSFNEDTPYDRFIREQLAGDEIDGSDPELAVAVGFLRMGPWEHTGMSVAAVTRQLFLDDVTHSTVNTFLGLTMGCARCHDHKFDPIPTRDYYRVQAVFAPVQFEERPAPFLASERADGSGRAADRVREEIRVNRERLRAIKARSEAALRALLDQYGVDDAEDLPEAVRPRDNRIGLTEADQERERVYRKRLELLERALKRYEPRAFSVSSGGLTRPVPTPEVAVLIGGSLEARGEVVAPGVLGAATGGTSSGPEEVIPAADHGRRLALARWIARPEHPLTARVMVNRIWQGHFGTGLVATSNNFGKMGKRPSHPELLDWLAATFVERGWSVKAMHRLILRSAAYRRAADHPEMAKVREADPEDALLAYFPPRQLAAEELRDAILSVAGELSPAAGGPPVYPEMNRDVALQPRQIMGTIAPMYRPSPSREERHRRTIYAVQMRNLPDPLARVFNAADMNVSCERREASTVAPQVFALFNGEFPHAMALAMARRLEGLAGDRPGRVAGAFRLAFGRPPTESERVLCLEHLAAMEAHHRRVEPPRPEERPATVTRRHVGELSGKPFAFVEDRDLGDFEPNLAPADVSPETRALAELCLVLINSNEFLYLH